MKIGIVGLPNVGKSTFFNVLTESEQAKVGNYAFCTIDANTAEVSVHDPRLRKLALINKSKTILYPKLEFVDIAGLIEGASDGAGLGNKFLSHISEVDLIIHLVRCFEDDTVIHVAGGDLDPLFDLEIIFAELMQADLKKLEKQQKKINNYEQIRENILHKKYIDNQWLSTKPYIVVCNGDSKPLIDKVKSKYPDALVINIQMLQDFLHENLSIVDKEEYFSDLYNLIYTAYRQVGYISFFTSGPEETRAWRIIKGTTAYDAAGKIHTDIQKKFVFAECTHYGDYNGTANYQLVGKDYVVEDGDILFFRASK